MATDNPRTPVSRAEIARPLLRQTLTLAPTDESLVDGVDPVTLELVVTDGPPDEFPELRAAGWNQFTACNFKVYFRVVN